MSKGTIDENPFAGFNLLDERPSIKPVENKEEPTVISKDSISEIPAGDINLTLDETETPVESTVEPPVSEPVKEESTDTDEDFSYKPFIEHHIKKGVLDVEEEDLKDEDFSNETVLEKAIEKTVEKKFQKKKEQYSEKLRKAMEWEENGGDIDQFYNYHYNNVRYSDISLSSEDSEMQKAILQDYLISQGHDEDKIKTRIEKYELSGILEDEAQIALESLQKLEAKEEKQKIEEQKAQKEQKKIKELEEWNNLKKAVLEAEEIAGFSVTPKIKEKLWEHMTKPVDKSGKTKLQVNNETKGLDAKLLYAYLDMIDFDITKLEKQVKTKVTSDLRKNLNKFTDSRAKSSSGSKSHIIEQENSFDAFRRLDLRNK